ncbi:tRNA (adenosine(37)-N6)-dimethylallyltransferase MiaA [bacterium]|nr:tRNA (adenosine(37)-N6)-dimethylallyltransferase MiaA [candidate division CSSED10-310 bacterium]
MMPPSEYMKPLTVIIAGPTGSGKSSLALALARSSSLPPIEIISADSRQVYRGMDIGTDKVPLKERQEVPHYLIDIINPDARYSAADFTADADRCIQEILARRSLPLVVGGTGLYLRILTCGLAALPGSKGVLRNKYQRFLELNDAQALHALLQERDQERSKTIHATDSYRIIRALELLDTGETDIAHKLDQHAFRDRRYTTLKFVLSVDRKKLYTRIDERVDQMISRGLVQEVENLLRSFSKSAPGLTGIGYSQICRYLDGDVTLDEAIRLIRRDSRRYAKRQLTWFRKEPDVIWIDHDPEDQSRCLDNISQRIRRFYEEWHNGRKSLRDQ